MSDCVLHTGSTLRNGYGQVGKGKLAHRVAWEAVNGPIEGDLTVDHLCGVKLCLNVAHMELVTRAENTRRAARKITHCPKGHSYEDAYIAPLRGNPDSEHRDCRSCRRDRNRRDYLRRKELMK